MKKILFVLFLLAVVVSACASPVSGPQITVENVWGRNSPKMAMAGAFYMVIKNSGSEADKLVSATAEVCGSVELHESYMMDDGTMGMRPVTGGTIEIPAGGSVELKVGGLHVMCLDKMSEFALGDTYPLKLVFEKTGEISVDAVIQEAP